MPETHVLVLGPVQAERAGCPIGLHGPQTLAVLSLLLLAGGEAVTTEYLIDALWPEAPPASARAQVQAHISSLRRTFGARSRDPDGPLLSLAGSYRLNHKHVSTDAQVFASLLHEGRDLLSQDEPTSAWRRFRHGLALWRGSAYAGVSLPAVRYVAEALDSRRLDCAELAAEAGLALGQHETLVDELTDLVARNPLRERLRALLMTVLARSGLVSEAVAAYHEGCRVLEAELGAPPSQTLTETYDDIRRGAPGFRPIHAMVAPAPSRHVPRTLPPTLTDLAGRDELINSICRRVMDGPGPACVALTGLPGIGKTAAAVMIAHQVRSSFPDGQVFVSLGPEGHDPPDPAEGLARMLTTFGIAPADLPRATPSRAALLRDLLAGRRVLVVVDDVATESQLRPLLPAEEGCALLVTSRRRLTGVDQLHRVPLRPLDAQASLSLLRRIAGDRIDVDLASADAVVRLCGGLPVALRAAGARLATRTNLMISDLLARLRLPVRRLDWLAVGDISVRELLRSGVAGLDPLPRRLLDRICAVDLPTFPGWAASALLHRSDELAARVLDDLVEAHLVEPDICGVAGPRYAVHPLLRLALAGNDDVELHAAVARTIDGYRFLAALANEALPHPFAMDVEPPAAWSAPRRPRALVHRAPSEWFGEELLTMLTMLRYAAAHGDLANHIWPLVQQMAPHFDRCDGLDDWRDALNLAEQCLTKAHDRAIEALDIQRGRACLVRLRAQIERRYG